VIGLFLFELTSVFSGGEEGPLGEGEEERPQLPSGPFWVLFCTWQLGSLLFSLAQGTSSPPEKTEGELEEEEADHALLVFDRWSGWR